MKFIFCLAALALLAAADDAAFDDVAFDDAAFDDGTTGDDSALDLLGPPGRPWRRVKKVTHATWGASFSQELGGMGSPGFMIALECSTGDYCNELRQYIVERMKSKYGGFTPGRLCRGTYWTRWFDENSRRATICKKGYAITDWKCADPWCGRMKLRCSRPDKRVWQVAGKKKWSPWTCKGCGRAFCPRTWVAVGAKCKGRHCARVRLRCQKAYHRGPRGLLADSDPSLEDDDDCPAEDYDEGYDEGYDEDALFQEEGEEGEEDCDDILGTDACLGVVAENDEKCSDENIARDCRMTCGLCPGFVEPLEANESNTAPFIAGSVATVSLAAAAVFVLVRRRRAARRSYARVDSITA